MTPQIGPTPALDLTLDDLQSAWERVQWNAGCAGVDAVTVEAYERQAAAGLPELLAEANQGRYRALPLRLLVVEKKSHSGKRRELMVPAVRDRILQTAVARRLSHSWEQEFLEASYAYRPDRGVDRAVARIVQLRDRGWTHAVDADIAGFFDNVSHSRLLTLLREQMPGEYYPLVHGWVKSEVWNGHELKPVRRGIPQGSPLSPLMANFFLMGFDREMENTENKLIRYSDDFLILCRSRADAEAAERRVAELLASSGLRLNPEKTRLTTFEEGFRFLGVHFRGQEAMIPWRGPRLPGRLVFLAHPMPQRLLRQYRSEAAAVAPPRIPPLPARESRQDLGGPDMAFLYVTQQGAILRKSGDRFLVEVDQHIALDLPYHRLENILVFGNVQVTTQAMAEALDKGVGLSLFTRNGRFRAALAPPGGRNVDVRIAQYALYSDRGQALAFAKAAVAAKIRNGLEVVERYEDRDRTTDRTAALRATIGGILNGMDAAKSRDELDGYEGAAAKAYFDALMLFNRSPLGWVGRVKHPATDPLNALLSLAYTLLTQELNALVEAQGLDPALGFLHDVDGARPSLALDLMEPFRHPVCDRFVLAQINQGVFGTKDFDARDDHGGVVLDPAALRRFFERHEQWMLAGKTPFRRTLQREVERLITTLRKSEPWTPFRWPEAEAGAEAASA